jgi:hypothetical protein
LTHIKTGFCLCLLTPAGRQTVSQADRFEFVVNLKTAKEPGIEIPAGLVAGATAVIE